MFESLEARRLLSVSATFSDGSKATAGSGHLTITGASSTDNNFVITELDADTIPANGNVGTVLVQNAVTGEEAFFSSIKDVNIASGSGNDVIFYNGVTAPAHIATGEGADIVTVLDRGNVSSDIDTGGGNDVINIVYSHNASIAAAGGDDVININTAAGAGYTFYDYNSSDIVVNAGGGNDDIIIFAGDATIKGGGGDDTLFDLSHGTSSYSLKQIEVVNA